MRNGFKILIGKPEGKRPFEKPRRIWEYNIELDLRDYVGRVCIGFIWLRAWTGGWIF
jgi:hypothetical protein